MEHVKSAKRGDWVQIESCILPVGERAPQVPEETAGVPLVMKVKGFLQSDAGVGDEVSVETLTGRILAGTLIDAAPRYRHDYGDIQPELLHIGLELRQILRDSKQERNLSNHE